MSKLALGSAQFGLRYGVNSKLGPMDLSTVTEILDLARHAGIDMLDTAPSYGRSEAIIGGSSSQNFDIVTKVNGLCASGTGNLDFKPIGDQLNQSLQRLMRPKVYGLLLHNINDILGSGGCALWAEMLQLKADGLVYKVGASVYDITELDVVVEFGMDIVQLPINILDGRILCSGALKKLKLNGIEVHARSIFLQGVLLSSNNPLPNYFSPWKQNLIDFWNWCDHLDVSPLEVCLRYAMGIEEVDRVVVGIETLAQLDEIISASGGDLPKLPSELQIFDPDLLDPRIWPKKFPEF